MSAVKDIIDLGIVRRLNLEGWLRAAELSADKEVSIYDAVYGAMALILDGVLVTSDENLRERIKDKVRIVTLDKLDLST